MFSHHHHRVFDALQLPCLNRNAQKCKLLRSDRTTGWKELCQALPGPAWRGHLLRVARPLFEIQHTGRVCLWGAGRGGRCCHSGAESQCCLQSGGFEGSVPDTSIRCDVDVPRLEPRIPFSFVRKATRVRFLQFGSGPPSRERGASLLPPCLFCDLVDAQLSLARQGKNKRKRT